MDANTKYYGGWLTLNRACNLKCGWCYAKSSDYKKMDMPIALAENLLSLYASINVHDVILVGGEPTLYSHLTQLIKKAIELEIELILVSNGIKFSNPAYAEKIYQTGIKNINISVKGRDDLHYEELTKSKEGYSRMIAGYRNLKKIGINPTISITVVKPFLEKLQEMLCNLIREGIEFISIDFGTPFIEGDKVLVDYIPTPAQSAQAVVEIYQVLKGKKVDYSIYANMPLCLLPAEIKKDLIKKKAIETTCHLQAGTGIIFNQKGEVLPCNHFASHPLGTFGSDFTTGEEFIDFWENSVSNDFRKQCCCYPHELCAGCPEWQDCGGGCLVNWLYWDPANFITKRGEKHERQQPCFINA